MSPAERKRVFQIRASDEDLTMLNTLAEEDKVSASDVVRALIRSDFERRFEGKVPTKLEKVRAALDMAVAESKRDGLKARLDVIKKQRKAFDRQGVADAVIIAEEEKALVLVEACLENKTTLTVNKALLGLEELSELYSTTRMVRA